MTFMARNRKSLSNSYTTHTNAYLVHLASPDYLEQMDFQHAGNWGNLAQSPRRYAHGRVAERRGKGLQIPLHGFKSRPDLHY